jgi:hypothetical protein
MGRLRDIKLASGLLFFAGLILFYIWPGHTYVLVVPGLTILVWLWATSQASKVDTHKQDLQGLSRLLRRLIYKRSGQLRSIFDDKIHLMRESAVQKSKVQDDLDLEGQFSLTTLLDECTTIQGLHRLQQWLDLRSTKMTHDELVDRQIQVTRLAKIPRKLLRAGHLNPQPLSLESEMAKRIDIEKAIRAWDRPLVQKPVVVYMLLVLWVAAVATGIQLGTSHAVSSALWTIFVISNIVCARWIGRPFAQLDENLRQLVQLRALIKIVQRSLVYSVPTNQLKVKGLERTASFLSTETNPYVHFGLHLLAPWTPFWSIVAEGQRRRLAKGLASVGPEVEIYDATRCLAILYAFFETTMPELATQTEGVLLQTQGLHHPLLDPKRAVRNDFAITPPRPLALITGSNMAGKSTWLRALALNLVLLRCGAPVFARSLKAIPLPMLVSLRLSDSLEDGSSYFSAEADRIVQLVSAAQKHSHWYFIDEMFRGTNSRERLLAGRSVIAQLEATASAGLVASHDTALGTDPRISGHMANWHFREEASEKTNKSELTFDYKLREGVATETNALRILSSRGLAILPD